MCAMLVVRYGLIQCQYYEAENYFLETYNYWCKIQDNDTRDHGNKALQFAIITIIKIFHIFSALSLYL